MSTARGTSDKRPSHKARSSISGRVRVLGGALIVCALILVVRLYFVQVIHGRAYAKDAMGQYVESSPESDARGSILFVNKDGTPFAAAIMQTGWRVAIKPVDVVDAEMVFNTISAVTPIDREKFLQSVAKKSDPYEEVALHVSDQAASAIRAKKLQGVLLVQDEWRSYPGASLAAHVIGFVGFRGDVREGVYGLESQYDDMLRRSSTGRYVNPFAEIFTNAAALVSPNPTSHGGNIVTSIEPTVQQHLEDTLKTIMDTYHPTETGGIVMDPHTGEIVAMAALPTFDPNTYRDTKDVALFQNPLVERRYEMGSIMKPLTMAAGLDTGAVTASTTYNDTGCIMRSGKKVCNFDFKARGVIPMQEVLSQSLNVGATYVEEHLGKKPFTQYVRAYGFGQKTGIDLPGEIPGEIGSLGDGSGPDVNYATASFGQGLAVTPIEMIRGLAALANEGKLPSPHVVTGVQYESGITRAVSVPSSIQVLKPASADAVTSMLITVFDKGLLHGELKLEHYTVAAKTGTAQIAESGGGGYLPSQYLHSFFGYFPAREPKYIIFLYAVKPQGVQYASASLAHPFMNMASFMINYYSIPPDR